MADTFSKLGYEIVEGDRSTLLRLRELVYREALAQLGEPFNKPVPNYAGLLHSEAWFDGFHQRGLKGPALNQMRLGLQTGLAKVVGHFLFEAFPRIAELVGADVVQQKGCNLVIAQPGDSEHAPTHRDAPLNSNFEVICWLPLVKCYGTKSMAMLNLEQTQQALGILKDNDYADYKRYAREVGQTLELGFGEACLFWAGLVHTIPTNQTQETRWSLNHRFKSFWAPYGEKGSSYFELLRVSPLTEIGIG